MDGTYTGFSYIVTNSTGDICNEFMESHIIGGFHSEKVKTSIYGRVVVLGKALKLNKVKNFNNNCLNGF